MKQWQESAWGDLGCVVGKSDLERRPTVASSVGTLAFLMCAMTASPGVLAQAATGTQGAPTANDFATCRALSDAAARLACYDALPLALPSAAARSNSGSGAAVAATSATTSTATASSASAATSTDRIGLPNPPAAVERVESQIVGTFDGWDPNSTFTLANGQVWRIADGSRTAYPSRQSARIVIEKTMFGSFVATIEGVNHTPRMRRVK
jgi:hypothetical protein